MIENQPIIELHDYCLPPTGTGLGIGKFDFVLAAGDAYGIETAHADDARIFLRALATLARPSQGAYLFDGRTLNLADYRAALDCKRKIGYVSKDAALISNLSIRQNLLLMRYYFENTLSLSLDPELATLCSAFGIADQLDQKPSDLNALEYRAALIIREVGKKPVAFIFDQPEDFLGHSRHDVLLNLFQQLRDKGVAVVFLSFDQRLVERCANRKIIIADGRLVIAPV